MADDTVERKTLIGFVAAVAVLVLACGGAILSVQGYRQSVKWVTHTYEVIDELDALAAALNSAEAARGEFLATGESSHLEERAVALAKVLEHVQSAKMLTADNAQQQRRLRDLEGYLEGPAARVAEANPRIEALENTERTLLVARHRIDDLWGEGLLTAFLVLLITATAVLTWLCRRIRKEMAERKRQTAALDKANLGLEAANRELESFSYSVSHDLRSPLRAIDGYSQMLEEDYGTQLDDTGRRYIRTVRGGSQRMAALIDDLLTFSRLSRQSLNRQTVDMTALARRAAAEVLEGQPEPKPAVRIAELPPVAGDPALLRQVWTNLIGNAVKYSSKAATPQVQVRAATEGRLVRYEVQDNGVGFDMKYVDKLFGVFQRLHGADEYP
ncbi:MAG: histidine kinase, partial [Gammaproteobacteria bacterium]|nr:histidine kinase [Gammaproteobacteria bacterium]